MLFFVTFSHFLSNIYKLYSTTIVQNIPVYEYLYKKKGVKVRYSIIFMGY